MPKKKTSKRLTEIPGHESILVRGAAMLAPGGFVKGAWLLASQGIIAAVGTGKAPKGADIEVNAEGRYLLPGFIDLHVHGGGGGSVNDATPESIVKMLDGHARHGTTLGIHLEGPHLNREKTGGLAPRKLRRLSTGELDELNKTSGGIVKMLTLAPEVKGSKMLIKHCLQRGIVPAIAHTTASFKQTREAIDAGLRHATHVPNAFVFARNAREPGALEAVLLDRRVTVQLIAESEIVSRPYMAIVIKLKGASKVSLITDSMRLAGLPGQKGPIRNKAGTLIGSTLTMTQAVRNINQLGVPLEAACAMASINPASVLGLQDFKGSLEVGKHADFIVTSRKLDCLMSVSRGRVLYMSRALKSKRRAR